MPELSEDEVREIVREALDNLTEYAENMWMCAPSAEQECQDLVSYCSDLEDQPQARLLPHVAEWRAEHGL